MDEVVDEKIGRTVYVLQERHSGSDYWHDVDRSYFEDDMDELFNQKYDINGHNTYYQIVKVEVVRRA